MTMNGYVAQNPPRLYYYLKASWSSQLPTAEARGLEARGVLMPSFTPFILQNVPADGGVPHRNLTLNWVGYSGRPMGDVEACHSIPIGFISTWFSPP